MKKYFFILVIILFITSCATLVNSKFVEVSMYSQTDSVQVCLYNDTSVWYNLPTSFVVKRSRNDLLLLAKKDDVQTMIQVNSKLSKAYKYGNLWTYGFGYLVDLTNQRRFTYPSDITITLDSKKLYKPSHLIVTPPQKGLLRFKYTIPEGNHFYLNKGTSYGQSYGFLGLVGGAEYFITDKYAISTEVGGILDFMLPFPAPVDYYGARDHASALFGNVQIGSYYKQLHYSCGLQYNKTNYNKWDTLAVSPDAYYRDTLVLHKVQNNMGIVLSSYYEITPKFNIGLSYYPSFITWNKEKVSADYNHLLFLDLIWRIEAYRPD